MHFKKQPEQPALQAVVSLWIGPIHGWLPFQMIPLKFTENSHGPEFVVMVHWIFCLQEKAQKLASTVPTQTLKYCSRCYYVSLCLLMNKLLPANHEQVVRSQMDRSKIPGCSKSKQETNCLGQNFIICQCLF